MHHPRIDEFEAYLDSESNSIAGQQSHGRILRIAPFDYLTVLPSPHNELILSTGTGLAQAAKVTLERRANQHPTPRTDTDVIV